MATQGMIVIMQGKVVLRKIVVGCNGYNAKRCSDVIRNRKFIDAINLEIAAEEAQFGCASCRVIQVSATEYFPSSMDLPDDVAKLYRDKFMVARFNPRWSRGTVAHCQIIKIPKTDTHFWHGY